MGPAQSEAETDNSTISWLWEASQLGQRDPKSPGKKSQPDPEQQEGTTRERTEAAHFGATEQRVSGLPRVMETRRPGKKQTVRGGAGEG